MTRKMFNNWKRKLAETNDRCRAIGKRLDEHDEEIAILLATLKDLIDSDDGVIPEEARSYRGLNRVWRNHD